MSVDRLRVADTGLLEALAERLGPGGVATEGPARVVARPDAPEGVAAALGVARERRVPVYPVGDAAGYPRLAGLLLDLSRLSAIVELNREDMLAVARAGVPARALDEAAATVGLAYPPALLAPSGATVGGGLARGGRRGLRCGPDRDYALGVRAALAGGQLVGAGSRAIKYATGYSLTQLLAGSLGALGVVVEATVRLVPRAAASASLLAGFPDAPAAAGATRSLLARPALPTAAELLDRAALRLGCPGLATLTPGAGAALLVLLEATSEPEALRAAADAAATLELAGGGPVIRLQPGEAARAWAERRELRGRLDPGRTRVPQVELSAPTPAMPGLIAAVEALAERLGAAVALSGGVAAGSLEVAILDAGRAPDEALGLARELAPLARAGGGRLAATEGFGLDWPAALDLALPAEAAAALRQVKAALDPTGILRPAAL